MLTKTKLILLALAALGVAVIYYYLYKDWFTPAEIQIFHRVTENRQPARGPRGGGRGGADLGPWTVAFGLNQKMRLTSVRVVSLADLATNKYPHALWHLVSDSNSVPVKAFTYGQRIPGMRPRVAGVPPERLNPGAEYRLLIEGEGKKAQHDFKMPLRGGATR